MPADPRYKALLIGNGSFDQDPHTLTPLHGPATDLPLLFAALTHAETGLFAQDNVRQILDGTQREVLDAIDQFFRDATAGDHLLFYYSGHGWTDKQENLYLCVRDTRSDRLGSTAIPDQTINLIAGESLAQKYIFVLDCCRSGGFKGGQMGQHLVEGSGRCLITACASHELSKDAMRPGTASAFTQVLAEALTNGAVDADGDGVVLTSEIFKYVQPRVRDATKQTVQWSMDKTFGEAAIARTAVAGTKGRAVPAPEALPPEHARPVIELSETNLEFRDVHAGEKLPVERIDVHNTGGGRLDWLCETEEPWIKAERQADRLHVTLDTAKSGRHRGKITVRDCSGVAAPKVVRVFLHVAEPTAPPPLRPQPPNPPPPPNHDAAFVQALQGWWMNNAGAIRIRLEGGALVLHDFNLVGLKVGQGTIQVQHGAAHVQGVNSVAGPYTGQLGIQGNVLNASLMVGGQMAHVMFMRQSPWFAGFAG
ncbi:MAG: caspase family protein [Opitutaceae bacterium]|nr:caspase family protein [Opitutaceae bacterium]